jgi:hypothetical protein
MNIASDTDNDFWTDLDRPVTPNKLKKNVQTVDEEIETFVSAAQDPYTKENFRKLLDRARESAEEVYKNKLKVQLYKQAQQHESIIKELTQKHSREIRELVSKFFNLDDALKVRDVQLESLQRYFIYKEGDITSRRLSFLYKETPQPNYDYEKLYKEKEALMDSFNTLKELVKIYEKDIEDLKSKLEQTEKLKDLQKSEFDNQNAQLREKIEKTERECGEKIKKVNEKYLEFKKDIRTELELRNVVTYRQQEIISCLKLDLNTAKKVLDTPRLLFKYNSKFPERKKGLQSVPSKPARSYMPCKSTIRHRKHESIETLISTRASPVFTLSHDADYPSSVLPTYTEY